MLLRNYRLSQQKRQRFDHAADPGHRIDPGGAVFRLTGAFPPLRRDGTHLPLFFALSCSEAVLWLFSEPVLHAGKRGGLYE